MHTRLRAGQSVTRNALSSNPFYAERPSICRAVSTRLLVWLGSLSGVRFSSGITPKCVCCGVKNRVPASIRCMIQFAPFFQFAHKWMPMPKGRSTKDAGGSKGGDQAKKMLQNDNSQTIAKGSRRQHNNVKSTRSLDKGTWKRQMLEPHEKQSVRLGQC